MLRLNDTQPLDRRLRRGFLAVAYTRSDRAGAVTAPPPSSAYQFFLSHGPDRLPSDLFQRCVQDTRGFHARPAVPYGLPLIVVRILSHDPVSISQRGVRRCVRPTYKSGRDPLTVLPSDAPTYATAQLSTVSDRATHFSAIRVFPGEPASHRIHLTVPPPFQVSTRCPERALRSVTPAAPTNRPKG